MIGNDWYVSWSDVDKGILQIWENRDTLLHCFDALCPIWNKEIMYHWPADEIAKSKNGEYHAASSQIVRWVWLIFVAATQITEDYIDSLDASIIKKTRCTWHHYENPGAVVDKQRPQVVPVRTHEVRFGPEAPSLGQTLTVPRANLHNQGRSLGAPLRGANGPSGPLECHHHCTCPNQHIPTRSLHTHQMWRSYKILERKIPFILRRTLLQRTRLLSNNIKLSAGILWFYVTILRLFVFMIIL